MSRKQKRGLARGLAVIAAITTMSTLSGFQVIGEEPVTEFHADDNAVIEAAETEASA